MLAGGLPRELCNGDQQRPDWANAVNQTLPHKRGFAWRFALLGCDDQGIKARTQF